MLVSIYWLNATQAQQRVDSAKYETTYTSEYFTDRMLQPLYLDTALHEDEIFHPLYRNLMWFQDLGNTGTAANPLVFNINNNAGFVLGANPFGLYYKTPQNALYYNTKKPLTDFRYTQGPNDFILFSALASANILPNLNIGVDFTRNTGKGFYQAQNVNQYFTQVFGSYQSTNKKFKLFLNYNWNRGTQAENGGLQSDSLFETLAGNNKAAPVKLLNSESRFKNSAGNITAYYYLGKPKLVYTETDTSFELNPLNYFKLTLNTENTTLYYGNKGDSDLTILPNLFYDTVYVYKDSVHHASQSLNFSYNGFLANRKFYYAAGINYNYIAVKQRGFTDIFNNTGIDFLFEKNANVMGGNKQQTLYGIKAKYLFTGYNAGNSYAEVFFIKNSVFTNYHISMANNHHQADYMLSNFNSNNFRWKNNFNKVNEFKFSLKISTSAFRNNFHVNINQFLIQNFVYLNQNINPLQHNSDIAITSIMAEKTFQIKWLYLNNIFLFQQGGDDIIRLPLAYLRLRYYAGFKMLKTLQLQMGVTVFYNSAFKGNAYNPAARMFYLQNNTQIGNYPVADVFITALVKKASFYFKYAHVNADFINEGFYYTPGYPLALRALFIGLRWRMYN